MMENSFVKKIVSGVLRNRKMAAMDRGIMHPQREWFVGIFAGLIFLVIGATWSALTYKQFSNVSVESSGEQVDSVIYRESLVEAALSEFAARKNAYEDLKKNILSKNHASTPEPAPAEVLPAVEAPIESPVQTETPPAEGVTPVVLGE